MAIDRRTRQRFPLGLEIRFTAGRGRRTRLQGQGEVVNISSKGVAFRTTEPELTPGLAVQASLSWPVALDNACLLRVAIDGHIIRKEDGLAVMSVDRYEFRTGGRVGMVPGADAESLRRCLQSVPGGIVTSA